MSMHQKIDKTLKRYRVLEEELGKPIKDNQEYAKLSKEYSDLQEVADLIVRYKDLVRQKDECSKALDEHESEMKELLEEELKVIEPRINELYKQISLLLIPKDKDDDRNAILEIRAGTGGDEAGLFAGDLFRMYERYANQKNWKFEVLSLNETGIGSVKEASALIKGKGVFSKLKYESGVHRVQRVPTTEASGRIHTSTATVAVLPEVEEVEVEINEKDLKIDCFRASGAGGQHVNVTDSAVRITHIPTGIAVSQQDERSQHKNKAKALKILRSHLYELERRKKEEERIEERRSQIGTGERSERIRTYNFPQGRVTDHRINLTLYKIDSIMEGSGLDEVIDALIMENQAQIS